MKKSQALTTMKLTLKPEHQKLIEAKLNTGRYANPDEIIAEALQLLRGIFEISPRTWLLRWEDNHQFLACCLPKRHATPLCSFKRGIGATER